MPRLSILISTIDEGICTVVENMLPFCEAWQYIVVWQRRPSYKQLEHSLWAEQNLKTRQQDVHLFYSTSLGLSNSRNEALYLWNNTTEFALIADDDMRYTPEQLHALMATFEHYPIADILCCQMKSLQGEPLKEYPITSFFYPDRPKGYYVSSGEIALRANRPYPHFDVRFGLGAPFFCAGEEEIFIEDCFRQGRQVFYFPLMIGATTNVITTSQKSEYAIRMQYTKGAVLKKIYGRCGGLLRLVKAAFVPFKKQSFVVFKNYLKGYFYV